MRIRCAYCGKDLDQKAPEQQGLTHGLCEACEKRIEDGLMLEQAIDGDARWRAIVGQLDKMHAELRADLRRLDSAGIRRQFLLEGVDGLGEPAGK